MNLVVAAGHRRWWVCLWCLVGWLANSALHATELPPPLPERAVAAGEAATPVQLSAPDVSPATAPAPLPTASLAKDLADPEAAPPSGRGLSLPSDRPAVHWPSDFDPPAHSDASAVGLRPRPDDPFGPASGLASWYGRGFHGRRTASGEAFSRHEMTAAHRTLPLGSLLHVTNPETGAGVVVRINDRGPFSGTRVIDLSQAAAHALGIVAKGVGRVELRLPSDDEAADFASRLSQAAKPPAGAAAPAQKSRLAARVPRRPSTKQAKARPIKPATASRAAARTVRPRH